MVDGYRQTAHTNEKERYEILYLKTSIVYFVDLSSKSKAGSWTIEHQIELRDLFRKIKEEQIENIGLNKDILLDFIYWRYII